MPRVHTCSLLLTVNLGHGHTELLNIATTNIGSETCRNEDYYYNKS